MQAVGIDITSSVDCRLIDIGRFGPSNNRLSSWMACAVFMAVVDPG